MAALGKSFRELVLHHYWKNQPLPAAYSSMCGNIVRVTFPGWFNSGRGPDFSEAQITVGDRVLFGDVEIHISEKDWQHHGHANDSAYQRVILHIFVKPDRQRQAINETGIVYSVCLPESVTEPLLSKSKAALMKNIQGACGIAVSRKNLSKFKKIIVAAGESRLLQKSRDIKQTMIPGKEEECLYQTIFESMGGSKYKGLFAAVARQYTYRDFLKYKNTNSIPEQTVLIENWKKIFHSLYFKTLSADAVGAENQRNAAAVFSGRYNNPIKGFQIIAAHLIGTASLSLFDAWIGVLTKIGDLFGETGRFNPTDPEVQKQGTDVIQKEMRRLFVQKTGDSSVISNAKLTVLAANAIIPFFLAWAERESDSPLRRTLFLLFMLLPCETDNHRISFMKSRLGFGQNELTVGKSLSECQGLIQLYIDCCHYFDKGCQNCSLARMLSSPD